MQKALLIGVLGLFTLPLLAETQTGYVRTIGRNGKPGQPISGVMVRAEGPANMVMSDSEGQFALLLNDLGRNDAFKLTTVKKSNYELLDKDLIGRECGFTPVPMEIVLVNLSEMQAEKAAMAERFEQKYAETYQKKVAELQAQLDAQQITIDEAQKRQEELDQALEKMLGQIETLVDRYVRTDYDRLDSLDQVINAHIEQGEFDEAERLIRSKGSVEERLAALHESEDVQKQLEEAQKKLAAANEKKRESLKRDLNLLIDIADAHLRPDSAYYYRKQLAEADPKNTDIWLDLMWDANDFEEFEQAFSYFDIAESIFWGMNPIDTVQLAHAYSQIGVILELNMYGASRIKDNDTLLGVNYFEKEKDLLCSYYGWNCLECAKKISFIGLCWTSYHKHKDIAKKYYEQAIQICNNLLTKDSSNLWARHELCYTQHDKLKYLENNRSLAEEEWYNCNKFLLEKAMEDTEANDSLIKRILDTKIWPEEERLRLASHYYPSHMNNFSDSLGYAILIHNAINDSKRNSKEISEQLADSCCKHAIYILEQLEQNGTDVQDVLCPLYLFHKDYKKAKECWDYENIVQHAIQIYGLNSEHRGSLCKDAADFYLEIGDTAKAIHYYEETIDVANRKSMQFIYWSRQSYNAINEIYKKKGMYDKVIENLSALLNIAIVQGHHIAYTEMNLGRTYQEMGDKKRAKEWYQKALKVYREKDDPEGTAAAEAALAELKKK